MSTKITITVTGVMADGLKLITETQTDASKALAGDIKARVVQNIIAGALTEFSQNVYALADMEPDTDSPYLESILLAKTVLPKIEELRERYNVEGLDENDDSTWGIKVVEEESSEGQILN